MRSIQRIIGLLSLSVLIAGSVYVTTSAETRPSHRAETRPSGSVTQHDLNRSAEVPARSLTVASLPADDCAKKRARGRRCDDDDDNRNGNNNRNSNHNGDRNDNRNGNNNSDDNR